MLSTRNPELVRILLTNFDVLFNLTNFLIASLCLGASFGFDERAVAFLLVPLPIFAMTVLGDATMSDTEFEIRRYFLLVAFLLPSSCECVYSTRVYSAASVECLLVRLPRHNPFVRN